MANRKESSFLTLLEEEKKNIVIPIIQRDYAQGRDDEKAIKVRERLIDDWIAVLEDENKRMDFNFIYGEEAKYGNEDIFFPVDGQQRLTSLYLLHWYLSYKTGQSEKIKNWSFDYKTRNSASEFFAFLKSDEAKELYTIVKNESDTKIEEKLNKIKDEKWFKVKWENDPTISACLSFLCTLSAKLRGCEVKKFWDRLLEENPAIYFTFLPEKNENSEIRAARTYTRMNARGKRLTDFENLKAMIDELEFRYTADYSISATFDCIYIDHLYKKERGSGNKKLAEITRGINEKSIAWFRIIYYIYTLSIKKREWSYDDCKENYENEIYRLSQGRGGEDTDISEYLKMLKAVLETVCYSDNSAEEIEAKLCNMPSKEIIAFVLFVYYKWNKQEDAKAQIEVNKAVVASWELFKKMLLDLNYEYWNCRFSSYTKILCGIMSKYSTVQEYFVRHDFDTDNPFGDWSILSDLKCRVLENKIMWKMIEENPIIEKKIDDFRKKNSGRLGYLFYLCGILSSEKYWALGDWKKRVLPQNMDIDKYISVIDCILNSTTNGNFSFDYKLKAIYAYASQYNSSNKKLDDAATINECKNNHIWNSEFLKWIDDEYKNLKAQKIIQLDNFRNMVELMGEFQENRLNGYGELCNEYYKSLKENVKTGYEDCWLRFVLNYENAGEDILNNKLENDNGVKVVVGDTKYDVALRTFLQYKGYSENKEIELSKLEGDTKWYYKGCDTEFKYKSLEHVCVFQEDGIYEHSTKKDRRLETSRKKVNMDIMYEAYQKLSYLQNNSMNYISFEKDSSKNIEIRIYNKDTSKNGKVVIKSETIVINLTQLSDITGQVVVWSNFINSIVQDPDKNLVKGKEYDLWLDLREGDIPNVLTVPNKKGESIMHDFKKGVRRKHTWKEVFSSQICNNSCSFEEF